MAPHTFTKCMDAALSPLRQMGIRILNYLDELLSHRSVLLSHLECLGLRVKLAKSVLSPSQRSWVTVIDSARMRAVVTPERVLAIQQLAASIKLGVPRPLKVFQRMLGLLASASSVLQLGLLHMRPLQYWLNPRVPPHAWHHGCLRVIVKNHQWMERGVPLGMVCRKKVVSTDASNVGWGSSATANLAFGLWSKKEDYLPINCLQMLAVCLGLHTFQPDLRGHHILVRSDSMTVVSYINHQGGLSSKCLFILSEVGSAQLTLAESEACARQTEPGSRHAISEQCPLR